MKYNTITLGNGLRIIHLPSTSQVLYCGYGINAGTRNEQTGQEGLAHFCEHVTFKGTRRRKAWHIINALESVGGDLNAFTNKEDTVYYAALPCVHAAKAVDVLTDIVFYSIYPQAEIDKEVEVICDEIESYNDSPAELIFDDFENILFEGHPLGHNILGTAERVRSFTTADALAFTQRYYRPENAVFFAYGDIDFHKLVRQIEKLTADFPSAQPVGEHKEGHGKPLYAPKTLKMAKGTHQAHVMMGSLAYDIHDARRMALYLLNNILGGPGMNARLNLSLREHHGLVYSVESSMVSYGDTGLWSVYFGCDARDVNRCLRLVRRELDRVIARPLSEYQLKAAKKQIKGQISVACDSHENFAIDFGRSFLHYGWEKDIEALYRRIDGITAESIRQVAADIMAADRLTTLVYE